MAAVSLASHLCSLKLSVLCCMLQHQSCQEKVVSSISDSQQLKVRLLLKRYTHFAMGSVPCTGSSTYCGSNLSLPSRRMRHTATLNLLHTQVRRVQPNPDAQQEQGDLFCGCTCRTCVNLPNLFVAESLAGDQAPAQTATPSWSMLPDQTAWAPFVVPALQL